MTKFMNQQTKTVLNENNEEGVRTNKDPFDIYKTTFNHYKAVVTTTALTFLLSNDIAFASLQRLADQGTAVNNMVKGPIGTAALLVGTIGGSVGSLIKGNVWLAISILVIGVLLGFHVDNITAIFAPQQH